MAFSNAISDLVRSIYEAIGGIFHLVYSFFHGILAFIAGVFAAAFNFVSDTVQGLVSIAGGVGKFVAGNFLVIGVLAAAGYFYVQQQQQQRKTIKANGANKKTIKTI